MIHGTMLVHGTEFATVTVRGEVYIHQDVLLSSVRAPRDPNARFKAIAEIDRLLISGMDIQDIVPPDILGVNRSTARSYLRDLQAMSFDIEPERNSKRLIKWVRESNANLLLDAILP